MLEIVILYYDKFDNVGRGVGKYIFISIGDYVIKLTITFTVSAFDTVIIKFPESSNTNSFGNTA
jgi:hypothetical protein